MQLESIEISKLKAAKYNPRRDLRPGDSEYEKLKRSIKEFGYVEPVVWNRQTGNVVGGHQRLKILRELGYTEVDCVAVELDAKREKALNLALNKVQGEWDLPMLADLLGELNTGDFDMDITGFDSVEIEALISELVTIGRDMSVVGSGNPWMRMPDRGPGVIFHFGEYTTKVSDELYQQFASLVDSRNMTQSIEGILSRAIRDSG